LLEVNQDQSSMSHSTHNRSFRRQLFQAIDRTGTDNQKPGNKTPHTLNTKKKQKKPP